MKTTKLKAFGYIFLVLSLSSLLQFCGNSDDGTTVPTPVIDTDSDGITDSVDNCPDVANADQTDTDMDEIGDVCDAPSTPGIVSVVNSANCQITLTFSDTSDNEDSFIITRENDYPGFVTDNRDSFTQATTNKAGTGNQTYVDIFTNGPSTITNVSYTVRAKNNDGGSEGESAESVESSIIASPSCS